MTKILVISDTHKNISNAVEVIEEKKPDYVLHLGDLAEDAEELQLIYPRTEIIGVRGNCYWVSRAQAPDVRVIDIEGVRIMMCHGHTYGVKNGLCAFTEAAMEKGVEIALFGHTHIPMLDNRGDIIIINPGTIRTYAWIEIDDGEIDAKMCSIE